MNPGIEKTVKNICKYVDLTDEEKMFIALEIGHMMLDLAKDLTNNPNLNFNGDGYIDINTFGYESNIKEK